MRHLVELVCGHCARSVTTITLAKPRALILVPRQLRCLSCGGQPIAGDYSTETSYAPMPRVGSAPWPSTEVAPGAQAVRVMTLAPGDPITWLHQPRGGYGYVYPVDGTVVRVAGQRVVISVPLRNGRLVERRVRPEHLKLRLRGEIQS